MKRAALWIVAAAFCAAAGWQAVSALNEVTPAQPAVKELPKLAPVATVTNVTPMGERVAILGILNKRNGLWRDLTMKPGQAVRLGDVVVRLSACEQTAPWEQEKWTGAFVQVIAFDPDKKWRRYFSGWLYKESPSLNMVENPIWDVWVKDCKMKYPETGKDTIVAKGASEGAAAAGGGARRSSAPSNAPETDEPDAGAEEDVAEDSIDQ